MALKVLLVILHADPSRGGAERYTIDLAGGLGQRGHRVAIAASSFAPGFKRELDVQLDAGGFSRESRYLRFLDSLDRHLAIESYDVVHAMLPVRRCDVYHPHAGIAAGAVESGHLKHERLLPRAVSRLSNRFNRRRRRFARIERQLLCGPRVPRVICLSEYVKRNLLRYYPLVGEHACKLFNAIDLCRFDPARQPDSGNQLRARLQLPRDSVVGLIIANDFERKGLRQAILAIGSANDPRLKLLVVGRESTRPYQSLADQAASGQVIFAGSSADTYPFYRAADFFILPTRHDPCSLVVLEALAMGLPVISTAQNGACEIMTDGREGYILPDAKDPARLSDSVKKMLDDSRRSAMHTAAMTLREQLAYDRHLIELEKIYGHAVAR